MNLSREQILALAPDASAASAGQKLATPRGWQDLGRSAVALWGQCQGSALYQVKCELASLATSCTCPSRKFPCKHGLGLLLLAAGQPQALPETEAPPWVVAWLEKRQATAAKKTAAAAEASLPKSAEALAKDAAAKAKRADQREHRVRDGVARLDLWLRDLVRGGLAGLETKSVEFWEEAAKRLVDAQAPGLAGRVRRLATLPGSGRDWPQRLLEEMGRLKLAITAFARLEQLPEDLRSDLRQLIGWTIGQEELEAHAQVVADQWTVIGQWIDESERVRTQRSWLAGQASGRSALVLQFAAGPTLAFPETIMPGSRFQGELQFYPGSSRQRARIKSRSAEPIAERDRPPASSGTVADLLAMVARGVAHCPWMTAWGAVISDAVIMPHEPTWYLRDRVGQGLPLAGPCSWKWLALTGGRPVDLTGEWDGNRFRLLGIWLNGTLIPAGEQA